MTTDMGPPPSRSAVKELSALELGNDAESPSSGSLESEQPVSGIGKFEKSEIESERSVSEFSVSVDSVPLSNCDEGSVIGSSIEVERKPDLRINHAAVPYTIPPWSGPPSRYFFLEVLKDGAIIEKFDVDKKGAYMFGRVDLCDFVLEHPTISRFHAVLQFKTVGDVYIYDLGSTHGTFINKKQVAKRVYVDLHVGDVIRFGQSSRLYIFQGPTDLMPQEGDLKSLRKARVQQDMQDMEASLLRAKLEASRADGISWGMHEDAVEDDDDEVDEITWQNYQGQLTEKQEKTKEKVIKRLEKISHMKKEIDAIRVKDIPQGGLTQGQQTQIARNEQRISQLLEELENLEETLNDSIRESLGARSGRLQHVKKKGTMDEDDDLLSDDDEFYDRTKKSKKKNVESKSIETSDSLLDKKECLVKQIEDKEKLLDDDNNLKEATNNLPTTNDEDALDAYMSSVSSQLVLDTKEKIQKELSTLRSELDRILYLQRLADPTGEAARRRESAGQKTDQFVNNDHALDAGNGSLPRKGHITSLAPESCTSSEHVQEKDNVTVPMVIEPETKKEEAELKADGSTTTTAFKAAKPQWLGAVEDRTKKESTQAAPDDHQEIDGFVEYKDRHQILANAPDPSLQDAAPGLVIRKRKAPQDTNKDNEEPSSSKFKAEDAVALLLKHSKGYHVWDEDDDLINDDKPEQALGRENPSSLREPDYESWLPPKGQSGDGRTSLNDRFGY